MFQNLKALYYLCLGRWSSHRKEWKPSCLHIEIRNLYQRSTTRKRKWIQSSPLILKLVNNYLGSISCVFCASWLVSKQSGACEQYLGTLRFLYRTIISGGVYEEQGGDSMRICCFNFLPTSRELLLILSPTRAAGNSYSLAMYFLETPGGRCALSLIKPVLSHGCLKASKPEHSISGQAGRNESHLSKVP